MKTASIGLFLLFFSIFSHADPSLYCPQNHGFINVGMSQEQVIAACGQPTTKKKSNNVALQQIPVTQLLYNNVGSTQAFYGVWALSVDQNGGAQLEVNLVDNKVVSAKLNNTSVNSFSICHGSSVQVGDDITKIYNSCGSPSLVNKTFVNQPISGATHPELWIYQSGPYQSTFSLTFWNGKLQSINK